MFYVVCFMLYVDDKNHNCKMFKDSSMRLNLT